MNHLYYELGDSDLASCKSESLPSSRPALRELLDENEDHGPTRILTFEDLYALWLQFREVGGYVDEECVTLKAFAHWILDDECEVTW
jgi:hypothetical protein